MQRMFQTCFNLALIVESLGYSENKALLINYRLHIIKILLVFYT